VGTIVGAVATSHAFALAEPGEWDGLLANNRASFQRRYGKEPPVQPEFARETIDDAASRFARVQAAHETLHRQIVEARPDLLVLIGDDQNELLLADNLPQLAVYSGEGFSLRRQAKVRSRYRSHQAFAASLVERGVDDGFDFATLGRFPDDELKSHAHWQFLDRFLPDADIPVVIVFMNAIHHPAVSPKRCYAVGELIARVIASRPERERAFICASGGLSHFTAGYPWPHYHGPFGYGGISQDFDRRLLRRIEAGEGRALADELTSADLLLHGDIEFRAWIALLGAVGAVPSRLTVYEPFYRAIMGMGVASWPAVALAP
jgi:hypothetical protein